MRVFVMLDDISGCWLCWLSSTPHNQHHHPSSLHPGATRSPNYQLLGRSTDKWERVVTPWYSGDVGACWMLDSKLDSKGKVASCWGLWPKILVSSENYLRLVVSPTISSGLVHPSWVVQEFWSKNRMIWSNRDVREIYRTMIVQPRVSDPPIWWIPNQGSV